MFLSYFLPKYFVYLFKLSKFLYDSQIFVLKQFLQRFLTRIPWRTLSSFFYQRGLFLTIIFFITKSLLLLLLKIKGTCLLSNHLSKYQLYYILVSGYFVQRHSTHTVCTDERISLIQDCKFKIGYPERHPVKFIGIFSAKAGKKVKEYTVVLRTEWASGVSELNVFLSTAPTLVIQWVLVHPRT